MRQHVRHEVSIPIFYDQIDIAAKRKDQLKNISLGGLCFKTKRPIREDSVLVIQIPLAIPPFRERAMVMWCQGVDSGYEVGVRFLAEESSLRTRMVEQVCYIEKYRRELVEQKGIEFSGEEAGLEWIRKYASDFPQAG